jgi:poly(A) polymerase
MLKRIRELFGRKGKKPSTRASTDAKSSKSRETEAPRPPVHRGPAVVHRPIPHGDLDPDAVKIVQRLTRFDHSAYLVGGCVRDLLLDRRPKDFDLGTSATPRQVKRLFRNCRIIGRRFRLAHIYFQNGKVIEVATFRSHDGNGNQAAARGGRDLLIRDDNRFGTPEEDALRRDFTINSLFYDVNNETVLDHTEGLSDLRRKLVRTIGDPEIRFREDPIRILRAIKFAARLDFEIEGKTLGALKRTRCEIPKAAAPRIIEEINRLCRGGAARHSFELLRSTGVFPVLLPELTQPYAEREASWNMLFDLLDGVDRRHAAGEECSTGEILASLILPAIQKRLGWEDNGTAEPPQGVDVREAINALLRPIALRLRFARKDQETCRLILTTLYRMVPVRRVGRNSKRSILQRDCLPSAVWMLEAVASRLGGDFTEAANYWKAAGSGRRTDASRSRRSGKPAAGRAASSEQSRRRGRRRPPARKTAAEKSPAAKRPKTPAGPGTPRQVDDDYFFSALPTVPKMAGEENDRDRYGAAALGAKAGNTPTDEPRASAETDDTPRASEEAQGDPARKPRRRRRPRRRKRGGQAKSSQKQAKSSENNDD